MENVKSCVYSYVWSCVEIFDGDETESKFIYNFIMSFVSLNLQKVLSLSTFIPQNFFLVRFSWFFNYILFWGLFNYGLLKTCHIFWSEKYDTINGGDKPRYWETKQVSIIVVHLLDRNNCFMPVISERQVIHFAQYIINNEY